MTSKLTDAERGDIVQHRISGRTLVVMANYGTHITAADTSDITNPDEWELVARARYEHNPVGERKNADGETATLRRELKRVEDELYELKKENDLLNRAHRQATE